MRTVIRDSSRDRYHSLSISKVWQRERVRSLRALVVGCGALGNEVAKNLALLGVRAVALVDKDTVEVANVARSVFFRETDHGESKVAVLATRLRDLNPDVEIAELDGDLSLTVGNGLVRRADLVFSCLDNRLARRSVNRTCQRMGVPWVDGAMEDLHGEVSVYDPDDGPCYECGLTDVEKRLISEALSCRGIALRHSASGKVATTSTMGSIVAAFQVQEGMKLVHEEHETPLVGRRLVLNCLSNDFYATGALRKEECPAHNRFGEVTEVEEWRAAETTPAHVLAHLREETGEDGHVRLGREIVLALTCHSCGDREGDVSLPLGLLTAERATCPRCGEVREPETTRVSDGTEPFADWPLAKLGVPPLEVLEARTASSVRWFELTGDAGDLPDGFAATETRP